MPRISQKILRAWVDLGPRFLPFADAATPDLPLSRLLRLSLFQVSVGMALVLLIGTLNRVMIVELGVPASLVGGHDFAAAAVRAVSRADRLPLRHPPLRARLEAGALHLAGHAGAVRRAGDHAVRAAGALRRRQCAAMRRCGSAISAPASRSCWSAPDCTRRRPSASRWRPTSRRAESQPKVVGLMYVMLLVGMIVERADVRRDAREFHARPAGAGHPGLGRGDHGPERRSRCGSRRRAGRAAQEPWPRDARRSANPGTVSVSGGQRCGGWSRSAWAPWPSAWRTCCSSPMAGRSCT